MEDIDIINALNAAREKENAPAPVKQRRKPKSFGMTTRAHSEPGDYRGGIMTMKELHRLAADHTPAALKTIAQIMVSEDSRNSDRLHAAEILLDRAWGKAVTPIEHGGTIEVAAGARERLAAILDRIGEIPARLSSPTDAVFTEVAANPGPVAGAGERGVGAGSSSVEKVLRPPPRNPEDE